MNRTDDLPVLDEEQHSEIAIDLLALPLAVRGRLRARRAEESPLRLACDGSGSVEFFPALKREERLLGQVVERARHLGAVEISERPQAKLDTANDVGVVLLARLGIPLGRRRAEPDRRDEATFRCDRNVLLHAERLERGSYLREACLLRPSGTACECRARDTHEPDVSVGTHRAQTSTLVNRRPDPLSALRLRRALNELAQRMHLRRHAFRNDSLDANEPAVTRERN